MVNPCHRLMQEERHGEAIGHRRLLKRLIPKYFPTPTRGCRDRQARGRAAIRRALHSKARKWVLTQFGMQTDAVILASQRHQEPPWLRFAY